MATAARIADTHRLFVAIRPPADICEQIVQLRRSLGLGGNLVRADRLHITLLMLPDYAQLPDGLADEASNLLSTIQAPPFRMICDRVHSNGSNAVLQPSEPIEKLSMFRERARFALMGAGIDLRPHYRFSPHITLGYNVGRKISEPLGEPLSWLAEDFVLIHSFVGLTQHIELGRWPLHRA